MAKKEKEPKEKDSKESKKKEKVATPAPVQKKAPVKKQHTEKENFRGIVRIAGKDMPGELPLVRALTRVRGISHTVAPNAAVIINRELSLPTDTKIGELSEEMIEKIDNILTNLEAHGLPTFLMNRREDFTTGKNRHIIMTDLLFETSQDIERDKKQYSWRGHRHTYGAKVRGQRTRNTGRTGMAVGVLRKTVLAAQAAGSKPGATGAAAAAPAAAEKKAAPAEKK